jgi:N-methylhydantoinase A
VVGRGVPDIPRATIAANAKLPEGVVITKPLRRAYFGPAQGWHRTKVINRADLVEPRSGPCIIEEYDSTCVLPPGASVSLDRFGNIAIDLPPAASG